MIPEKLEINKFGDLVAIYPDGTNQIIAVRAELCSISKKALTLIVRRYNGFADQQALIEQLVEALDCAKTVLLDIWKRESLTSFHGQRVRADISSNMDFINAILTAAKELK